MDVRYRVRGGIPLQGEVQLSGSKNAALPLLAASLLTSEDVVLHNVPRLRDTEVMVQILRDLGAEVAFEGTTVRVNARNAHAKELPKELVSRLRASIVLLGPMLARFGVVEMAYPGGDVIGKRPVHAHVSAFEQMGAENMSSNDAISLQGTLKPAHVILPEFSVTATENTILAAALTPGVTRVDLAATEPHVQEVAELVQNMGATIEGIGTHTLLIHGRDRLHGTEHTVSSDYLEGGSMVVAALVTKGKVRIHGVERPPLLTFLEVLRRAGAVLKLDEASRTLLVDGELSALRAINVRTNIFPGFPTDLQAPVGVAMTQATGVSRLFERLYEGRLAYLYELEKMGAHVEMLNAHQALVIGPRPLRGRVVASNDVRAGAAMVLAALCAEGETIITDVHYVERGYDRLDQKLRSLGAKIERMAEGDIQIG